MILQECDNDKSINRIKFVVVPVTLILSLIIILKSFFLAALIVVVYLI